MTSTHTSASRRRRRPMAALAATFLLVLTACGSDEPAGDSAGTSTTSSGAAATAGEPSAPTGTLNLGFFPNVTHAPALVGVGDGLFAAALGDGVDLNTFTFNAGTDATEALFAEAIDITFIGPNPSINAFAQSDGTAIRIIAGSTSGGAFLVVRPDITSPAQLSGVKLATPSLGNTQDVALRSWLAEQGFETTPEGGGDVSILPQSNSTTLEAFVAGEIDGAWVPEPWATRLVQEGGGAVLVDERDLWPDTGGEYVTTQVVVRTAYLEEHPDIVRAFLEGLIASIDAIGADPASAQQTVIEQIAAITGQDASADVIEASFANLHFTLDPVAASLAGSAKDAEAVGLLDPVDLTGIHDLTILNELLAARGDDPVVGL